MDNESTATFMCFFTIKFIIINVSPLLFPWQEATKVVYNNSCFQVPFETLPADLKDALLLRPRELKYMIAYTRM